MRSDVPTGPAEPGPRGAQAVDPVELGPAIRLPARREDVELRTDDGLTLVGELAQPLDSAPVATLVTLHPLPTHGGFMDSHVLRKAAFRLPALAGLAVLRFNLRGVSSPRGTSEGEFGDGVAEAADVAAALRLVRERQLPAPWLLGWSFGTDLALRHGREPDVEGLVLLSPPLKYATADDLGAWAADGRPVLALVPEHDDFLPPEEAVERFAPLRQARVVPVAGAKHLWVGERYVRLVLDRVVAEVAPEARPPLPTTWRGPYERVTDQLR